MKIHPYARIRGGQDGAFWGKYLFRMDTRGLCQVYDGEQLSFQSEPITSFVLDRADQLAPHSNAVMFGMVDSEAEFPLFYTNIYNNYAKMADPLNGVCCVYRLRKQEENFCSSLVQLIQIGFTNTSLWSSRNGDVRPYGNFTIDREKGILYAFTMRDESQTSRYFAFSLPKAEQGEMDAVHGVRKVVLTEEDILFRFDCPYHRFLQGACCHNGVIYSVEGFTGDPVNVPALRRIDPVEKKQDLLYLFGDAGLTVEPEMIDFYKGVCHYSDAEGNVYTLEF